MGERGGWGESTSSPLRFSILNYPELIVLNCVVTIFNSASSHLEIRGRGDFRSWCPSPPQCEFRSENGLYQLSLNCAQLCSIPFRSYPPSFRDLGTFFQYILLRSTTEVHLPSSPSLHCEFWSRNRRNRLNQLGSNCANCPSQQLFSILLVSFPRFRHFLIIYVRLRSMTEVLLPKYYEKMPESGKGGEYDGKWLLHDWAQLKTNWLSLFRE